MTNVLLDKFHEEHDELIDHQRDNFYWPVYYKFGEEFADECEDLPRMWRVDGPDGPVWTLDQVDEDPRPATMWDLANANKSSSMEMVLDREGTVWEEWELRNDLGALLDADIEEISRVFDSQEDFTETFDELHDAPIWNYNDFIQMSRKAF